MSCKSQIPTYDSASNKQKTMDRDDYRVLDAVLEIAEDFLCAWAILSAPVLDELFLKVASILLHVVRSLVNRLVRQLEN